MLVTGWHDTRRFTKYFIEEKMIQIVPPLVVFITIVSPCQEPSLSQVVALHMMALSQLPSLSYFAMLLRPGLFTVFKSNLSFTPS